MVFALRIIYIIFRNTKREFGVGPKRKVAGATAPRRVQKIFQQKNICELVREIILGGVG